MNWEELEAAHKEQTPLVWSVPEAARDLEDTHHEIVTIAHLPQKHVGSIYHSVYLIIRRTRQGRHHRTTPSETLRPATAQDLLEFGGGE